MQITHLVQDSPLRDLGVILSQCACVVVLDNEDSFEFDPEEELDIADDDDGDSDEIDADYVPEGGLGDSGESDGEGGEIQEEGMGTIQRGAGKINKSGVGKIQKEGAGARQQEGVGKIHKKGVGKIQKEGVGEIQKEGVGKVHKKGVGKIQRQGAGAIQKEGVGEIPKEGEGSGMGKGMRGSKRKCSATPLPTPTHDTPEDPHKKVVPRSPGVCIKAKMPVQTTHHAEGMVERVNKKNEVGTTIGRCYRYKECAFECATRAACIAHAHRKHTDELIGPCDYCGTYYAHLADSMKHVNECAGSTTSSDNTDD